MRTRPKITPDPSEVQYDEDHDEMYDPDVDDDMARDPDDIDEDGGEV